MVTVKATAFALPSREYRLSSENKEWINEYELGYRPERVKQVQEAVSGKRKTNTLTVVGGCGAYSILQKKLPLCDTNRRVKFFVVRKYLFSCEF